MAQKSRQSSPAVRYTVVALGVVVVLLGLVSTRQANAGHPEPRTDLSNVTVAPAARYAQWPRIARVYEMAAEVPQVLDGLYCHCDCSKHSGHRSLLACFQDDHGADCDVCLHEATLAHGMTSEGRSLKEIRRAIDEFYAR
ncbi:MAG TPA: CYCXC family (seleno)protein [Longimicrobiales bacterium]